MATMWTKTVAIYIAIDSLVQDKFIFAYFSPNYNGNIITR